MATIEEIADAHPLDNFDRLHCGSYCSHPGARPQQSQRIHPDHSARIVGAFVATYVGQAIGWYRVDQGAGVIGAIVGALLVLFVWHRLVSTNRIGDVGGRRWL